MLVIENFWSAEECGQFRHAMERANWNQLQDMTMSAGLSELRQLGQSGIAQPQGRLLLSRLEMPCIQQYIESFPNITRRHLGFSYYSTGSVIVC